MELMNQHLQVYFIEQLRNLHKKAIFLFKTGLEENLSKDDSDFTTLAENAKNEAVTYFVNGAKGK